MWQSFDDEERERTTMAQFGFHGNPDQRLPSFKDILQRIATTGWFHETSQFSY